MVILLLLAPPHYFLYFPSFLCALRPPVCVGTIAMLPLVCFTHSHRSLAWSLSLSTVHILTY